MEIYFNKNVMAANYSMAIIRLAQSYGVSEEAALEGTGITPAELHNTEQMLSINQNAKLTNNAINITGIPHLGLMLGQNLNVTAHGMMGIAIMSSKNLGDALNIVCQYLKTRLTVLSATNEIKGNKLILTIKQDSPISSNDNTIDTAICFAIEAISSSVHAIAKLLTQQPCDEFVYQFSYPAPSYSQEYKKVLGDNIFFSQGVNRVTAPASLAELPLPFYDEVTLKLALQNCNTSLSKQESPLLLKHKIKLILDEAKGEFPNIEEISSQFNMCSRTVRRKLQAEGISYQKIVNEKRLELAKTYLLDPNRSIIQISSDLNFSDPSYFARVFKQWTGYLPTEYRKLSLKNATRMGRIF